MGRIWGSTQSKRYLHSWFASIAQTMLETTGFKVQPIVLAIITLILVGTQVIQAQDVQELVKNRTAISLTTNYTPDMEPGDQLVIHGTTIPGGSILDFPQGMPVYLEVSHPDGSYAFQDFILDQPDLFEITVPVIETGYMRIAASFAGNDKYRATSSEVVLPIRSETGLVIVVAGETQYYNEIIGTMSDQVVRTLRRRGVPDDSAPMENNRILYLHTETARDVDGDGFTDVDDTPTTENLNQAITSWAAVQVQIADDHGNLSPACVMNTPLTIYLLGEIVDGSFRINGTEAMHPTTLNDWLDAFETAVKHRFIDMGGTPPDYVPVNLIVEANSSGEFIPFTSGPGRFVLTSTTAGAPSYLASGGSISFTSYFLSRIAAGHYISPSFAYSQLSILSNASLEGQAPQLETSGNGIPNEFGDEVFGSGQVLEYRVSGDAPPRLQNALGQISLYNFPEAMLWCYVDDPECQVSSVQAVIAPPELSFEESHTIDLIENWQTPGRYEGIYSGFHGEGNYTVTYLATDESGNFGWPIVKTVVVHDTTPPHAVTNLRAHYDDSMGMALEWGLSESWSTQGYLVYTTRPGEPETATGWDVGNSNLLLRDDLQFTPGVLSPHSFRVVGYDRTGLVSTSTVVDHFTTVPGAAPYVSQHGITLAVSAAPQGGQLTVTTDLLPVPAPPDYMPGSPGLLYRVVDTDNISFLIYLDYQDIDWSSSNPDLRVVPWNVDSDGNGIPDGWGDPQVPLVNDPENQILYFTPLGFTAFSILEYSPQPNTPVGTDIWVLPVEPELGVAPVTLVFDEVLAEGLTTVDARDLVEGPPPDYQAGDPPLVYDIETSAEYQGTVEMTFTYSDESFEGDEDQISVFHYDVDSDDDGTADSWGDPIAPLLHDMENNTITIAVSSLSPFALFEPESGLATGSIAGSVQADCPESGTPLLGVVVDAYDMATGSLVGGSATGEAGNYVIPDLPAGNYVVSVMEPLGYAPEVQDIEVSVVGDEIAIASFELACIEPAGIPRGVGFWKHQVGIATGGNGNAQITANMLCEHLDTIADHFNSNAVNQVVVYQPPDSDLCAEKLEVARNLLNLRGQQEPIARARQHFMALILNVAAGYLSLQAEVSEDGATLSQAVTYCDMIIDATDGNFELAKDISETINCGESVAADVIPLDIEQIAYRRSGGSVPATYSLEQNAPNPFNPVTRIAYALPQDIRVRIYVYGVSGKRVAVLVDELKPAGRHEVVWSGMDDSGRRVASGTYFCRMQAGQFIETTRMTLVK